MPAAAGRLFSSPDAGPRGQGTQAGLMASVAKRGPGPVPGDLSPNPPPEVAVLSPSPLCAHVTSLTYAIDERDGGTRGLRVPRMSSEHQDFGCFLLSPSWTAAATRSGCRCHLVTAECQWGESVTISSLPFYLPSPVWPRWQAGLPVPLLSPPDDPPSRP